jgi:4-hydroxy-4-methyl-2-oxoglutarate aldolase
MEWDDDRQLFELVRQSLYTPVVGDVLDALGFHHQFLPAAVKPMKDEMVVVGRAMPVLTANVFAPQKHPFGRLTEALDQIEPGEVYICTGTLRCASWGEILTATARKRGGNGAIVDGFHRDTRGILRQDWPVFSRGRYAQDAAVRSLVIDFKCPIEIEGVRIEPGNLVFGDLDGVVVIPASVEDEVISRALEKARGEKLVLREIEAGLSSTEAFRKYNIL